MTNFKKKLEISSPRHFRSRNTHSLSLIFVLLNFRKFLNIQYCYTSYVLFLFPLFHAPRYVSRFLSHLCKFCPNAFPSSLLIHIHELLAMMVLSLLCYIFHFPNTNIWQSLLFKLCFRPVVFLSFFECSLLFLTLQLPRQDSALLLIKLPFHYFIL